MPRTQCAKQKHRGTANTRSARGAASFARARYLLDLSVCNRDHHQKVCVGKRKKVATRKRLATRSFLVKTQTKSVTCGLCGWGILLPGWEHHKRICSDKHAKIAAARRTDLWTSGFAASVPNTARVPSGARASVRNNRQGLSSQAEAPPQLTIVPPKTAPMPRKCKTCGWRVLASGW